MDKLRHLTTPLLLLAILLIATPLIEVAASVWPVGPGNAEWRFGSVGLLSNAMLLPLLGSFIVVVVAAQGETTWLVRGMSVLNALAAVFLLLVIPLFLLDSLELRSGVPDAGIQAFDFAAARAVFAMGFSLVVLAALSRGGLKTSRREKRSKEVIGSSSLLLAPER